MTNEPQSTGHRPFRILALDGGGTFSLIQAKALADLYPGLSGHEVLGKFDLVAGCSGGAIVAAALIEGMSPDDIVKLFLDHDNRSRLFSPLAPKDRRIQRFTAMLAHLGGIGAPFGPRFSTDDKLEFLHAIFPKFGKLMLEDISSRPEVTNGHPTNFIFVTFDFDRDRTRILRSNPASNASTFPRIVPRLTVAEAAHASSTAPINWFDAPAKFNGTDFWDGAMTGYNNPVLAGVTEAMACGIPPGDVRVLSIGTSTVYPKLDRSLAFADQLAKVASLIISDPPDAHSLISHIMLGGSLPVAEIDCPFGETHVVRMNPIVQPVYDVNEDEFRWPAGWSAADIVRLRALDIATVDREDVALIVRLADEWLKDGWNNQPLRAGGRLFEAMTGRCGGIGLRRATAILCEVGHPHYSSAKVTWSTF